MTRTGDSGVSITTRIDAATAGLRMRRLRQSDWSRRLVRETNLTADDLISVRFEVTKNFNNLKFEPAENFEIRDEGTRPIPLTTYPTEEPVTEYESQSLTSLAWAIGFTASF